MKKIAFFTALGLCVVSAQAATIQWTVGATLYGVKEGVATAAFTGTARNVGTWSDDFLTGNPAFVLVYLGINEAATTADKVTASMIVQTKEASEIVRTAGSVAQMGKANVTANFTADNVVGATYQVFFSYDGVLKDLYTDADMTTVASMTATVVQDATTQLFSANPTTLYAAGSSGTDTYVAVPEPSTAALALAGLALLLKRRKA